MNDMHAAMGVASVFSATILAAPVPFIGGAETIDADQSAIDYADTFTAQDKGSCLLAGCSANRPVSSEGSATTAGR